MKWVEEQIEYWQKKSFENEQNPTLSYVEYIRPYVEIINLVQIKIQIFLNKENGKKLV